MKNTTTRTGGGMARFLFAAVSVTAIQILTSPYDLAYGGGSHTFQCGVKASNVPSSWTCNNASASPAQYYANMPFKDVAAGATYKVTVQKMDTYTIKGGCGTQNADLSLNKATITNWGIHSDDSKLVCTKNGQQSDGVSYQCTNSDPSKSHSVRITNVSCKP